MTSSLRVEVVDLVKSYGSTRAVDGLSFQVDAGRVLAMVGPNGAGKTTTLRAMAGIIRPTSGSVTIDGLDVATHRLEAKRRLAWVPHDPQLFDALTVWEHLVFVASAWQVSDWEPLGQTLLDRFELSHKRQEPAGSLSRGMRQKLALAMAGLHRPSLLMLDEPLTGLDPKAIRTMKAWIREAAADGAGVVISSHLLGVVDDLCTDLLILVDGRVRFFGPMEEARSSLSGERLEELFFLATEATHGSASP